MDRYGSISGAARNLFISQPALSRYIKELEQTIDITIFERLNTGVVTTPQGKEFIRHAKQLIDQMNCLQEIYFNKQDPHILNLKVVTVRYAAVIQAFISIYNNLSKISAFHNICIVEKNIEEVIDDIYRGLYNLGVLIISSDKKDYWEHLMETYEINFDSIHTQSAYVQLGHNHPLVNKDNISLGELADFPHATMAGIDVSSVNFCSSVPYYDHRLVKKRIVVNDKSTMYDVLLNTTAYYIGMNLSKLSPKDGKIKYIPLVGTDLFMECVVIYLKDHTLTDTEKMFINELKKIVKSNN